MEGKFQKIIKKTSILAGIMVGTLILALALYNLAYAGKIFPKTYLGGQNLGGKSKTEAKDIISQLVDKAKQGNLVLEFEGQNFSISASEINLSYQKEQTLNNVYAVGRAKNPLKLIAQQLRSIFSKNQASASFRADFEKISQKISEISEKIDQPEHDATLKVEGGEIIIAKEQLGKRVEKPKLYLEILQKISGVELPTKIALPVLILQPKVAEKDAKRGLEKAEEILNSKLTLKSQNKKFEVGKEQISLWLEFVSSKVAGVEQKRLDSKVIAEDLKKGISENFYIISPRLNSDKIKTYVGEIAGQINQESKDAKLTIEGGRVKVFQLSQDGLALDQEKATQLILEGLLSGQTEIALPVKIKKPQISSDTIDTLGIKELIGKGTTSFAKSPQNRIHNISVGASAFNGVLIKPGEEFSFLKNLGNVDASTGYLPELVIKEDRTTPEFGGGLCQVSTTMFRAALATGLPITERQNHSYRVSYYEPPVGMDATVYIPKPDLKFKNDTSGYILIQTQISGSNLTFAFYGTSDGRRTETTTPEIWDVVSPGEPIYADTPDLPEGEVKQIEKAHPGSKAKFTYTVYNADGSLRNRQTFVSVYKSWSARFLRGTGGVPVEEQPPAEEAPPEQPPA